MSDLELLNEGLAGEHFGIAAYRAALDSGLLDEGTAAVAAAFQRDHEAHRDRLASLVTARGGEPVPALSAEAYAAQFPPLASAADIVNYAIELEAGAARASVASVVEFEDRHLALIAAQIGAVEAQHWAALLSATGQHPVPAPFLPLDVPSSVGAGSYGH
jgi:rubrerythrin